MPQNCFQIGCHHCRGPHPLPGDLHKLLIEYRMGTVIVLLDENYETLISELVKVLPQRKMGQAIVWSVKAKAMDTLRENINIPKNLFIHSGIDRQDLIGIKYFWINEILEKFCEILPKEVIWKR